MARRRGGLGVVSGAGVTWGMATCSVQVPGHPPGPCGLRADSVWSGPYGQYAVCQRHQHAALLQLESVLVTDDPDEVSAWEVINS